MLQKLFSVFLLVSVVSLSSVFGQLNFSSINLIPLDNSVEFDPIFIESTESPIVARAAFSNPMLLNLDHGCTPENLNSFRFDSKLTTSQRVDFCQALQTVSEKLSSNWSPELRAEIQQIWQVFVSENVKIRPMKENTSSRIVAAAEAFTEGDANGFNASFYLRPERAHDKSFFLSFMHEMRHVYDFFMIWKNHSSMTEAELEKRGFEIMGRIYQEMPDKPRFSRLPTFWKDDWKKFSFDEINQKRAAKIEKFMRGNSFYKDLIKNPQKHLVGYSPDSVAAYKAEVNPLPIEKYTGEKLPVRLKLNQTTVEIPQQIKENPFAPEKTTDKKNPDAILNAAIGNEKNLYHKMDNFVYDQDLQLQCWKKEKVSESYEANNVVTHTTQGKTLFQNLSNSNAKLPSCVRNLESIKTDAAETFWAAPYLDQMPIKFAGFTTLDGIPVARYTVLQPTAEKFTQIVLQYPNIKDFRAFVGTIFVSIEDSQIIKFWGTSIPEPTVSDSSSKTFSAGYCATAMRQKLAGGIWVTVLLNTVAVTTEKDKIKPFSYVVKYQNYRQGSSDVKVLDETQVASLR